MDVQLVCKLLQHWLGKSAGRLAAPFVDQRVVSRLMSLHDSSDASRRSCTSALLVTICQQLPAHSVSIARPMVGRLQRFVLGTDEVHEVAELLATLSSIFKSPELPRRQEHTVSTHCV